MSSLVEIKKIIKASGTKQRAEASMWYFKTGKGQYGYGDKFIGITVPEQRKIAKQFFKSITLTEVSKLLSSKIHEDRFIALEILVMKYEVGTLAQQKQIVNLYLRQTKYVNNWDLVDTSASYILGSFLFNHTSTTKARSTLVQLAKSKNLWEKRISIIATMYFINQKQYDLTIVVAKILLTDSHDLIHKAVGWMLREVGNKDRTVEIKFLDRFAVKMPRTMLRYAIEKFPEKTRQYYLKLGK